MTSCCRWFIQPASEISKSRKGSRARVIATSYTPERPLARQTAPSMAFCFQRDRVFGHYGVVLNKTPLILAILPTFAYFQFEWFSAPQTRVPLGSQALDIIGMKSR